MFTNRSESDNFPKLLIVGIAAIKMIDPDHKQRDGDPNCEREGMKNLLRIGKTAC